VVSHTGVKVCSLFFSFSFFLLSTAANANRYEVSPITPEGKKICGEVARLVKTHSMTNPARVNAENLETYLSHIEMDPLRPAEIVGILAKLGVPLGAPDWEAGAPSESVATFLKYSQNGGGKKLTELMRTKKTAVEFAKELTQTYREWQSDPFMSQAQYATKAFLQLHESDPNFPVDRDSIYGLTVSVDANIVRVLFELGILKEKPGSPELFSKIKNGTPFEFDSELYLQVRAATVLAADEVQRAMNDNGHWGKVSPIQVEALLKLLASGSLRTKLEATPQLFLHKFGLLQVVPSPKPKI